MTEANTPRRMPRPPGTRTVLGIGAVLATSAALGVATFGGSAGAATQPVGFYSATATPSVVTVSDRAAVDLGIKFTPTTAGSITAIEFYKSSRNTGAHTGTLWSSTGSALATVKFAGETASGWQTAKLSNPVAVTAGTTYTASYHTSTGYYSDQENTFANGKTLSAAGLKATSGTYHYGSTSAVPTSTWHSSSYYVDVAFVAGTTGTTPPPTTTPPTTTPPTTTPPTTTPPTTTPPTTTPPTTGFPDAASTGPRISATSTLTASSKGTGWAVSGGTLTISGANVTLKGFNIPFEIDVKGPNAVIQDNTITARGTGWAIGLYKGNSNTLIDHNLIQGPDYSAARNGGYQVATTGALEYGIFDATGNYGGVATTTFNEFRYINHPLNVTSGTVTDNYLHNFSNPSGTDHTDAIFSGGGDPKPLVIRHNTMINDRKDASAAVVLLSQAFGSQNYVTIDDNLMAGGGFILYGAGNQFGSVPGSTHIAVTNNRISTQVYANGGSYGVFNVMPKNGANGNVISNNLWYDGPKAGGPAA